MPREQVWYQKVAETMVRESKNIRQAASEHGLELTSEELSKIEKLKSFQKVLWTERHRFFRELAADPERTKQALIGQMLFLTQKLIDDSEWEKAIEALLKLAKVEGLVGSESQINIFSGLTPQDLKDAKAKLIEQFGEGGRITQEPATA